MLPGELSSSSMAYVASKAIGHRSTRPRGNISILKIRSAFFGGGFRAGGRHLVGGKWRWSFFPIFLPTHQENSGHPTMCHESDSSSVICIVCGFDLCSKLASKLAKVASKQAAVEQAAAAIELAPNLSQARWGCRILRKLLHSASARSGLRALFPNFH